MELTAAFSSAEFYGLSGQGFNAEELRQLRTNLTAEGLSPADLMRGRPTVFVDLADA